MDGFQGSESTWTLDFLGALGLLSACERSQVNAVLGDGKLAACLEHAATIHLHIKVDDTDQLPRGALEAGGGVLDHARSGFVKYRMPARINAIFSHIAVSADDLRECAANRRPRPFLDHVGIDIRRVDEGARAAFDALPEAAASRGWVHVAQGGRGQLVRCCHFVVDEKRWLFPARAGSRPIEIALGPLRHGSGSPGCDLRPAHPDLVTPGACCPGTPT